MSKQSSMLKAVPLAVALAVAGFGLPAFAQGGASAAADAGVGATAGVGMECVFTNASPGTRAPVVHATIQQPSCPA